MKKSISVIHFLGGLCLLGTFITAPCYAGNHKLTIKKATTKISAPTAMKSVTQKTSTNICDKISKTIKQSRSIKQLKKDLKKIGVKNVASCKNKLKSDRRLQSAFKKLAAKQTIRKPAKKIMTVAKPITSKKIAQLKMIGQRQVATVKRLPKLNRSVTATTTINSTRTGASQNTNTHPHHSGAARGTVSPKIIKTIPETMAPGISVAINGQGFGDQKGSVQLKLNNLNVDASVDTWADNWITISFSENITRVLQTDSAQLVIKKKTGETISKTVKFIPKMETRTLIRSASSEATLGDLFLVGRKEHNARLFREIRYLRNQWSHSNSRLSSDLGTKCYYHSGPGSAPNPQTGGSRVSTAISWFTDWMEDGECALHITVEGPAGLEPLVSR